MKNMKFSTKLLLVILTVSMVSMIAVSVISYSEMIRLSGHSQNINVQLGLYASNSSKEALIEQAEMYMSRLSKSQAAESNSTLSKIQREVTVMAGYMEDIYKDADNFLGRKLPLPNEVSSEFPTAKMMVAKDVEITPELEREILLVSNAEYMFSNIYESNNTLHNAYLGTATGINFRYSQSSAYNPDFDPRVRPWYTEANSSNSAVWLDTYVDAYGNICTTNAKAFQNASGQNVGVVAVDILLSDMVSDILNQRIGETGYAFLLDNTGKYLAHPRYEELDPDALKNSEGEYKEVLTDMAAGGSNVRSAFIDGKNYYIAYAPLSVTGWSLGIAVEYDEIITAALEMKANIDSEANESKEEIRDMLDSILYRFIALSCVIIVVVLILSILVSSSVTKPIIKLTNGVVSVGKGDLNSKIDIQSKDEIGVLADCFNKMTDDLKNYIANLSEVTAEKERINSDLRIATDIQADMLPKIFPPFSNRNDIHISSFMLPAKEVGGDFYDFFFLDDEQKKIALVIADVSGKGVPAALFMVIAKVLIKNNKNLPCGEILGVVNNLLAADNNSSMFVTTFFSVLDLTTGEYSYASAGHNPPVLYRKESGEFTYLSLPKTPPLAIFPNKQFTEQSTYLKKGDLILLYTDGVTEAFNSNSEMYGSKRLLENMSLVIEKPVELIVKDIYKTIQDFAAEEPQSDDITMLCCRYVGRD